VITYTSSNPAVATVDQFGKVTALTEGEPTIIRTVSIANIPANRNLGNG
jgi:uncharacterized protein YjdB